MAVATRGPQMASLKAELDRAAHRGHHPQIGRHFRLPLSLHPQAKFSMSPEASPAAPPPFDDIQADVRVLRSSDDVDFPMRKSDLTRAAPRRSSRPCSRSRSPGPGPRSAATRRTGAPSSLSPSPRAACAPSSRRQPGPRPRIDAFDVAVLVLEAALKYEMAWARAGACDALKALRGGRRVTE